MIDTLKIVWLQSKISTGDYYTGDGGLLYFCHDADSDNLASDNPTRAIAVLQNTMLNQDEAKELCKLAVEKRLKDGDLIEVKKAFSVVE